MPNETGDMKLLGNFRKLIDQVSADTSYSPANNDLKPDNLETQFAAANAAAGEIAAKMAPYKAAINDRLTAYDTLGPNVIRARNMLKASGASKGVLENAETHVRKILGRRKAVKVKAAAAGAATGPGAPANEAGATHSVSQLSFENRLGSFDSFIEVLATVPAYNPNETDLKVTGLRGLSNTLELKNNAVSTAFVPLSQARGTRDQLLYGNADCVVNTALLAKAYVAAAFGTSSQLYKQLRPLKFGRSQK